MKKTFMIILVLMILFLCAFFIWGQITIKEIERSCTPSGKFLEVAGEKIHYLERDGGEIPVVLIHGASSNANEWKISLFKTLPEKYKLYAIDRPGLGFSFRNFSKENSLDKQKEILHKTILKLNIENPILIAHSLGGVISARMMSDYQESYRGLMLIAGAVYPIGSGASAITKIAELPVIGSYLRNSFIPILGKSKFKSGVNYNFGPSIPPKNYIKGTCAFTLLKPSTFYNNSVDLNQIRSYFDVSYPLYDKITKPVSLIYSRHDKIIFSFSHAAGFKHKVPQAKLFMNDTSGHSPHFDQIETIVDELERLSNKV